jgi:hypothetical protein
MPSPFQVNMLDPRQAAMIRGLQGAATLGLPAALLAGGVAAYRAPKEQRLRRALRAALFGGLGAGALGAAGGGLVGYGTATARRQDLQDQLLETLSNKQTSGKAWRPRTFREWVGWDTAPARHPDGGALEKFERGYSHRVLSPGYLEQLYGDKMKEHGAFTSFKRTQDENKKLWDYRKSLRRGERSFDRNAVTHTVDAFKELGDQDMDRLGRVGLSDILFRNQDPTADPKALSQAFGKRFGNRLTFNPSDELRDAVIRSMEQKVFAGQ